MKDCSSQAEGLQSRLLVKGRVSVPGVLLCTDKGPPATRTMAPGVEGAWREAVSGVCGCVTQADLPGEAGARDAGSE